MKKITAHKAPLDSLAQYQDEAIISTQLIKKKEGNVTFFAFDKGQSLSEHTVPFDALVLITDGTGEITIDGEKHLLSEGEVIIMPAHKSHSVRAVERFKMLLVMIKSVMKK